MRLVPLIRNTPPRAAVPGMPTFATGLLPEPKLFYWQDFFHTDISTTQGGGSEWFAEVAGTPTYGMQAPSTGYPGALQLNCPTNADRATISPNSRASTGGGWMPYNQATDTVHWATRFTFGSAAGNKTFGIALSRQGTGFTPGYAAAAAANIGSGLSDGYAVYYDGTDLVAYVIEGGVASTPLTLSAAASAAANYKVEMRAVGVTSSWYLNDALVGTITGNGTMTVPCILMPSFELLAASTATHALTIDYLLFEHLITAR